MSPELKNRSVLALDELSARDIRVMLEMAHELKRAKNAGTEQAQLRGKNIALLFDEKAAARTHGAFEVAAGDQGAQVAVVGPGDAQSGARESVKDTVRVLGRLYDAIDYRGFNHATARELARWAGVPVYNGQGDQIHPTQILADCMTMQEHCPGKLLAQMRLAFLGDARQHAGRSLLQAAALTGMDFRIAAPQALWPPQALIDAAQQDAGASGARLRFTASAEEAVQGVDFIYAEAWGPVGDAQGVSPERLAQLRPYQVNVELLLASGNPAVKVLHRSPLPRESGVRGLEVTDEVFESAACLALDQVENRVHTIKALLVATLA